MGILLLAALIGVPLIEIGLFIEIGGFIGLWPTLALVILTAVVGSWQLRLQGLATLARARQQLDRGQLPARELFDGFCLVIAGALLLTPGFMTDAVGLALFVLWSSGPGIAEDVRDEIFEPLFTTKAKGTGLGLAICRQLVERHGGTLDLVKAETGGGATFCIRLPRQNIEALETAQQG